MVRTTAIEKCSYRRQRVVPRSGERSYDSYFPALLGDLAFPLTIQLFLSTPKEIK